MAKRKIAIIVALAIIIIGGYFGIKGIKSYTDLRTYRRQVNEISISEVDLSKVGDGTYTGAYEVLWVAAEVKVTVKDHKIKEIELVHHKHDRGIEAEVIPGRVVEAQSLEVDVITGVTSSSKVILKAIENALNSGMK